MGNAKLSKPPPLRRSEEEVDSRVPISGPSASGLARRSVGSTPVVPREAEVGSGSVRSRGESAGAGAAEQTATKANAARRE